MNRNNQRLEALNDALSQRELASVHNRIKSYIHRTPVLHSRLVNQALNCELYFKCENLQKIGAFKIRGATNAVLQLSPEELEKGVCTHSSGNHAQAVALSAQILGVPAYIVMPSNAPSVKKAAVKDYGARIILCEPTLAARESTVEEVVADTGATFIHPYDNPHIIIGQATAAKELLEDHPDLDIVMAPVGGGGLLGGTSLAVKYYGKPGTLVWGAEPKGADDAYRSFTTGVRVPSVQPNTIADGLLTSVGQLNFDIVQEHVHEILLAEEATIAKAMRLIWERMKIVVEPSAAVPLAALLDAGRDLSGKKIGIVLSGGNVDLGKLPF